MTHAHLVNLTLPRHLPLPGRGSLAVLLSSSPGLSKDRRSCNLQSTDSLCFAEPSPRVRWLSVTVLGISAENQACRTRNRRVLRGWRERSGFKTRAQDLERKLEHKGKSPRTQLPAQLFICQGILERLLYARHSSWHCM